jgi:Tol biopolymer transport system component
MALVMTTAPTWQETLARKHPRLFAGSLTSVLNTLSSEEATRLITWPVDGILTYDYGVSRRLIEITSGQPYYLQLLCFEVFSRCAQAGWVNQRDLDFVIEDLVGRDIPEFHQVWDESSPQEQAILAALVSLRGARGVATGQEVGKVLSKAGARVKRDQVNAGLESLASRGILERLGALSYRFRVALLRDWLGYRIELSEVVRDTRWSTSTRDRSPSDRYVSRLQVSKGRDAVGQPGPQSVEALDPTAPEVSVDEGQLPLWQRRWIWYALLAVLGLILVGVLGWFLLVRVPVDGATTPVVPALASPTSYLASAPQTRPSTAAVEVPVATESPLPMEVPTTGSAVAAMPTDALLPPPAQTATPLPTLVPTPTLPLVVARPVPSIAYQSRGPQDTGWSVYVMNSDGSDRTLLSEGQAGFLSAPAWSPDGSRLAVASDRGGSSDIWVMSIDGREAVNLTNHEAKDHSPAWSPDGEWIAFASVRDSLYWEIYVMRADGSDLQRLTWWEDASDLWPTWSPDGTRLAFASKRDGNWEIYSMDRDGSNLVRLTNHPEDDTTPAWSPDGSRIAFESTRDGYAEVYVMPAAGGQAVNVSNLPWSTELGPTWSPDGGWLAYYSDRDGEWDIYVVRSDGSDAVKLTGDRTNDQVPAWRP